MPVCPRCGKELPPNSTFCTYCGSQLVTPVPTHRPMPSLPTKVSHVRRNVAVIGVTVIIILMVAILVASISSGPSGTTTSSEVQEGGTVTIGQAIIVKFGENEVPVRFIFNSASFNGTIGEFHATPDSGYRFLVLDVSVRNVGNGEVQTYMVGDKWEVTVDKGYVYQEFFSFGTVQTPSFTLRPEEEKVGYIVFEILKDATPLEVRYYKPSGNSPSIILNLRGYAFQTTTSAAQEYLRMYAHDWSRIGSLTPQPMDRVSNIRVVSALSPTGSTVVH